MNIYEKLLVVQQQLKAPKSQYNKFGDYHYRSCEDIQEALKPILQDTKTVLLLNDEIIQQGDRFYIKATAILQDTESTERICNAAYARECDSRPKMDAAQITGSCSSYARKYALNGLFCIDDARDPDTSAPQGQSNRKNNAYVGSRASDQESSGSTQQGSSKDDKPSSQELQLLREECRRTGVGTNKICCRYKVQTINQLSRQQYQRAMVGLKKTPTVDMSDQGHQMSMDEMMEADPMPFQ